VTVSAPTQINVGTYATATVTGTGNYTGTLSSVSWSISSVSQAVVTITSATSITYGTTYTGTATGGSGTGAIVWSLGTGSTAAGAAINASTGVITANSNGTVVIKAQRAADLNYPASAWTSDFPVSVGVRAITVTLAGSKTYNGTTTATGASASITTGTLAAGDSIGYAYAATSSANAAAYTGLTTATITNAGAPTTRTTSYAITYAGSYTINKVTVTAATIAALPYTGSAQSPTTTSSTTPAGATVTVSAPTQTNVGTYATATVTGTGNYTGTLSNVSWSIFQLSQTITFPNPGPQTFGVSVALNATASSGLPVTLSITSGSATLVGNVLTPTGMAAVTILATQAGNASYTAATNVSQTISVNKATPITNPTFAARTLPISVGTTYIVTTGFDLNATFVHPTNVSVTQPTGTATYAIATGSPSGTPGSAIVNLTQLPLGTYYVQANYPGDSNYNSTSVTATWTVEPPASVSTQLHLTPNAPVQNDSDGTQTGLQVHRPQ
jgi:hypothetical protein